MEASTTGSDPAPQGPRTGSPYLLKPDAYAQGSDAYAHYLTFKGKPPNRIVNIREVTDERNGIQLDLHNPLHSVISQLIDVPVVQRLRSIAQLGTAHFVYKDGEHSRFGHAVGSAYLAAQVLEAITANSPHSVAKDIEKFAPAVVAATLLHDIGHIAPRSHLGEQVWFAGEKGAHEKITARFFEADRGLQYVLENAVPKHGELPQLVKAILEESDTVPRWTWLLVSGGGWNLDRGDWVYRDSVHCGVAYGRYDVVPLMKRLMVDDGDLVVKGEGVRLIQNFFQARYNMYDFVYFHPVSRVATELYKLVGKRARELFATGGPIHADDTMQAVLAAKTSDDLPVETLLQMTDGWWEYHLEQWMTSDDGVLSDLASRIKMRRLFRHFPKDDYHREMLGKIIADAGLDPDYYLIEVPGRKGNSKRDLDSAKALCVQTSDGSKVPLSDFSALLSAYSDADRVANDELLAIPLEPFHSQTGPWTQ